MIDPDLITSVKKQDKGAFKMMYQKCIRYVYSIVIRYMSNESDHKDVIQEIFARIFLSIESFDPSKGQFKPWLRRLTINQCLQHYRKRKSPSLMVSLDHTNETDTDLVNQLETLSRENIESMLIKMPEGYRQVFMLVAIDEFSHNEVAECLGISPETSRSQFSRANKWLKTNLSQKINRLANGI